MKDIISAEDSLNRCCAAIKALRLHTDILQRLGEDVTEQLDRLDEAIRTVRLTDQSEVLQKLADRLQRLREYKNMMELGSFQIQMHNEIGAAWRRLP
jgi:hypothetical protein